MNINSLINRESLFPKKLKIKLKLHSAHLSFTMLSFTGFIQDHLNKGHNPDCFDNRR